MDKLEEDSDLPNCLNAGSPRMFADDTNVTFSAATIPDLESQINSDLKYIDRWLYGFLISTPTRQICKTVLRI